MHQRNQRAENIAIGDEGLGAIDGVDDPAIVCILLMRTELFADDAMVRVTGGNRSAQRLLGVTISGGDRRLIGLGIDGDALR